MRKYKLETAHYFTGFKNGEAVQINCYNNPNYNTGLENFITEVASKIENKEILGHVDLSLLTPTHKLYETYIAPLAQRQEQQRQEQQRQRQERERQEGEKQNKTLEAFTTLYPQSGPIATKMYTFLYGIKDEKNSKTKEWFIKKRKLSV